mmetsp:Transcript_24281/g.56380  ORF Transcript_24281/g.56380 Transcript_24281/m.56380 type:complete len:697 (+) Transcript_24281:1-2091(+)
MLFWLLTLWNPADFNLMPNPLDHAVVMAGCTVRFYVFFVCAAHICRRCACPFCMSCCCSCCSSNAAGNWRVLGHTAFEPGRSRLRYMLYYLITRPQFLLLVNLPIGYPIAFCAAFASTIRIGFSLLVAIALRPASHKSTALHPIEEDTQQRFSLALALRLADFGNETYMGVPPRSKSLRVTSTAVEQVSGVYEHDGVASSSDAPVYVNSERKLVLFKPSAEVWAIAYEAALEEYLVCVQDSAEAADRVTSTWCRGRPSQEVEGVQEIDEVDVEVISVQRRFQYRRDCSRSDQHWLLVEEEGPPHAPAKVGLAGAVRSTAGEGSAATSQTEVSIIVAFRGTASFQNARDDARIRMAPVRQGGGLLVQDDEEQARRCRCCLEQRNSARQALRREDSYQNPHFDFDRLQAYLDVQDAIRRQAGSEMGSSARATIEDWAEEAASGGRCALVGTICALLLRGVFLCCLPFRKTSDTEEDDEPFEASTLNRVRMHAGFSDVYQSVREDVMSVLLERLRICRERGETPRLYVTGHSLGGAVASLFALDIATRRLDSPPVRNSGYLEMQPGELELLQHLPDPIVYTFGAPRPGNAALRTIYNSMVPNTFRVVAALDLVPTMPPSIYYRQIGREIWLDDGGGITYVMSWAMRALLPARNSPQCHAQVVYFRLLNKAFYQLHQLNYSSAWGSEPYMLGVLDGTSDD